MKKKFFLLSLMFIAASGFAQWQQTNLITQTVSCFANNGNDIFAGAVGNGVYKSSNNSVNWTTVNSGLTNMQITSLALKGDTIFAGTSSNSIFLSINNGDSWTEVYNASLTCDVNALAINGSHIVANHVIIGRPGLYAKEETRSKGLKI